MNYTKRSKVIAALAASVVVVSVVSMLGFFTLFLNREHLRQNLNKAKLEQERTVSEKLLVDKDLIFLQREFQKLDETNQKLTNFLIDAEENLDSKDLTINKLQSDNRELEAVKNNLGELKLNHKDLETHVKQLTKSIDELIKRNNGIMQRMEEMQADQDRIRLEYEKTIAHKGIGRAFRVEAQRSNKLTTKARKTRTLEISFEPMDRNEYLSLKNDQYYIIMTDDVGQVYNLGQHHRTTVRLKGNAVEIMPSFVIDARPGTDKVNRIALVLENLDVKSGVYHFDIYTGTNFIGNTQIRLN